MSCVEVKLSLCLIRHCHDGVWGSGGIAPQFLTSTLKFEVSGQLHAPASYPPGKEPQVFIG
jgi:hypothetical protein